MKLENIKTLVLHKGVFHADDVFTTAFINVARKHAGMDPVEVIRTFTPADFMTEEAGYLVADVGKGKYDHHFPDAKKERRENGAPYAALGLVARDFHDSFLTETEYHIFDKKFIENIDYADNYGGGNPLSAVITACNRPWNDESNNSEDYYFNNAEKLAETIISNFVEGTVRPLAAAYEIANNITPDNGVIYLSEYAPIGECFAEDPNVLFIGSPSKRGTYQVITVKTKDGKDKLPFPADIRGTSYAPGLFNADGINFVHSSGFLASFKDKDAAKLYMDKFIGGQK